MTILSAERLTVTLDDRTLVRDLSVDLDARDRVGLIGESGSGKSLTALALLGLLPDGMRAAAKAEGYDVQTGARGVVINADPTALVRFLDIGTRVAPAAGGR